MAKPWEKYGKPWEAYQQPSQPVSMGEDILAGVNMGLAKIYDRGNDAVNSAVAWAEHQAGYGDGTYIPHVVADSVQAPETKIGKAAEYVPEIAASALGWEATAAEELPLVGAWIGDMSPGVAKFVAEKAAQGVMGGLGAQAATLETPTAGNTLDNALANVAVESVLHIPAPLLKAVKAIGKGDEETIRAAQKLGVIPTAGVASSRKFMGTIENLVSNLPGGAGIIGAARHRELQGLSDAVEKLKSDAGYEPGTGELGDTIKAAVEKHTADFKEESNELYSNVFKGLKQGDKIKTDAFGDMLDEITSRFKDEPEWGELLENSFINKLANQYGKARRIAEDPEMQDLLYSMTGNLQDGTMSTQSARNLRQAINDAMDKPTAAFKNVSDADLSRLYGALTEDLNAHFAAQGGDIGKAWLEANDHYAAGRSLINEALGSVNMTKTGDAVYQQLFGKESGALNLAGTQKLENLFKTLTDDQKQQVAAEVIHRAGLESAGAAGSEGRQFSPATFLTNWNKIPEEAKKLLFNSAQREALENLATYSAALKRLGRTANHSNTANHVLLGGMAAHAITSPVTGIPAAAAQIGATALTAKTLANPKFAEWLIATQSKEVPAAIRARLAVALAAIMNDPEAMKEINEEN